MDFTFTIAICTYNRADLIAGAMDSLCNQTLPASQFEFLIIDNASTDQTAQVTRGYQQAHPDHNIRYIYEPRLGLGAARNSAYRQAAGAYIGYLDDDARADPTWLEIARRLLSAVPSTLCLGGPIYPFYTTPRPAWFDDRYESHLWGDMQRSLQPGESLSGSNMIWLKEALERAGGFDENVGVTGKKLSVGEETSVFKRLWQLEEHPIFLYSPELRVFHWVPSYKMKVSYYLKRNFVVGQDTAILDRQPGMAWRLRTIVRSGGAVVLRGLRALFRYPRYKHWQNWAVEEGKPVVKKLGVFLALLGVKITVWQS